MKLGMYDTSAQHISILKKKILQPLKLLGQNLNIA
jgi:hypothetical protein